jgi:hypothetical protein
MPKSKMANRGKSALWPAIAKELMPWVNEAFLDPSDSYFLFAEERGYHR